SRRRHTRLVSDWSSDVCSSDLAEAFGQGLLAGRRVESVDAVALADLLLDEILERRLVERLRRDLVGEARRDHDDAVAVAQDDVRSEEGRGGEEGRAAWEAEG